MPTVEQNRQHWNQDYEWTEQGEEWSAVWGGSEAQWFGPYSRGFMLLFQQAQFLRLHRDSGDGQAISKSIVKT